MNHDRDESFIRKYLRSISLTSLLSSPHVIVVSMYSESSVFLAHVIVHVPLRFHLGLFYLLPNPNTPLLHYNYFSNSSEIS